MEKDAIINSIKNLDNTGCADLSCCKAVLIDHPLMGKNYPLYYPGGFAFTFKITDYNIKHDYALRVWTKNVDEIEVRANALSNYLRGHKSAHYFVENYDYISQGLNIRNQWVDVIKMNWIDGDTLFEYLKKKCDRNNDECETKSTIRELAKKIKLMFRWMHANKISHGDLQPNNIMVLGDELYLCDYDSVCVPELEGKYLQATTGVEGYQHPLRMESNHYMSRRDDYFSELIIYMGLLIFSLDPSLWQHEESTESYFYFTKHDFDAICSGEEPKSLVRLKELTISTPGEKATHNEVMKLVDLMIENLKGSYEEIKPMPGLDSIYCCLCGNEVLDHYKYCPICGYRLLKQKKYYESIC